MHAVYHCVLLSLDGAATFAAWIGRGEDQMIRHPVPRVTTKTETTMMVSFIKEQIVRCPPRGAVGWSMRRQTTAKSLLLPTENTHAVPR